MRIDKNTTIRLGDRNIVKVKLGDVVIWQKTTEPVVEPDYFYIESLGDRNTISVKNKGNGNTDNVTPTLEYSKDKNTWNTITFDWTNGEHTTELPVKLNTGEKMYFRNNTHLFSNSSSKYITFSSTVSSNVGGDIRTLSNYLDVDSETTVQTYMFYYLFYNNEYIVDASNLRLPYTTLANSCYSSMFRVCTSLTTAPALPATTLASRCYESMFRGCASLTTAPALPATTLASSCYYEMFIFCSKLTTAPALPATTLASSCYSSMFENCTSLTTAPALPATTLASSCYSSMFRGCASLVTAPIISATTLASNCCTSMFSECTSLVTTPELPATTLASDCYYYMFSGCTSLTSAPELPATKLFYECYRGMFNRCTSLTTAPELPATTLAPNCYQYMFGDCSKLNNITVYADDISATDCTTNWLYNVASTGTFNNYGGAVYTKDSVSGIPSGWTEVKPVEEPDYFYIENTYAGENTITFTTAQSGTPDSYTYAKSVEYSTDKKNWNTLTFNTSTPQTITIGVGEKLYLRNDSGAFNYYEFASFYTNINTSQNCVVGGNINTLINYNDADNVSLRGYYGCFYQLFKNAKNITDASNLIIPSTNITESYCREMFSGCTSLQTAPTLSATTLGRQCYYEMFDGCTSLTSAPELPATKLANYCYCSMFHSCTSLKTAPELPATTLSSDCYFRMFGYCTSLTTAPELPATTLANECYYEMFNGCKALTTAPTLLSTTLADYCYYGMFGGCTSLTTAPELPATKLATGCYNQMFVGCKALTTAPELPVTTLANNCYKEMFWDCTSLTTAPELPATTLTTSCYYSMFNGCSKLNSITVYANDISATDCTTNWLYNVASTGTFNNLGSATYPTGSSGIPSGWTEVKS